MYKNRTVKCKSFFVCDINLAVCRQVLLGLEEHQEDARNLLHQSNIFVTSLPNYLKLINLSLFKDNIHVEGTKMFKDNVVSSNIECMFTLEFFP